MTRVRGLGTVQRAQGIAASDSRATASCVATKVDGAMIPRAVGFEEERTPKHGVRGKTFVGIGRKPILLAQRAK